MRKLVVAALLGASSFSSRAEAYFCTVVPSSNPVLSQAWNQRCIPYFIHTGGTLLDGEPQRQLILQSFAVWTTPSCTDLSLVDFGYTDQAPGFDPHSANNENVIISVEDEASARELFTRNELAITITSFNTATGEIFDADILINGANFAFEDVSSTDECRAREEQPYDLRNTLIHEIGHFIGFEHNEADDESTMFASAPECETKKRDLTQDDILGVCTVYGTGSPTQTCAQPASYDQGPGDPDDFRNQCDRAALAAGCGCTTSPASGASALWLLLIGALLLAGRRLT